MMLVEAKGSSEEWITPQYPECTLTGIAPLMILAVPVVGTFQHTSARKMRIFVAG